MAVGPTGVYHWDIGIAVGASVSDPVNTAMWNTASIQIPTAFTNTRFSYQTTNTLNASGDPTGFKAAQGYTGDAIDAVVAATGETYPVPAKVMAAHYFRIVAGATAQAAARTLKVTLKS